VVHGFAIRILTGALLSMAALTGSYAQDCTHAPLVELPMIPNDDGTPIVSILIDGKPSDVLLDTGGFWSLISPSFARQFGSYRGTGRLYRNCRDAGRELAGPHGCRDRSGRQKGDPLSQ
jgi:hypothetical protein